jgi:type VI secretion system secreted protein Hcp
MRWGLAAGATNAGRNNLESPGPASWLPLDRKFTIESSRRIAMRIVYRRRLLLLCAVASALLTAVPAMAAVDAYMTIDGIKGESPSGSIHLVSVARDTASGMSSGKRMHGTITIVKEIDKASPKLFSASTSHQTLGNVTINFSGGSGDAKTAQKIVLTNAVILSVRKAGGNNEQITLDYSAIEVTYVKGGKTASDDWLAPN